jgi:hypothetical protein
MPDGDANIEATVPTSDPSPAKPQRERMIRRSFPPEPKKSVREQSTIVFPYMDMEAAISVARAMIDAGGVALTREQLAGVMKLSIGSGNFVTKTATARMFGFIANVQGKYELTTLGFAVVDKDEKRQRMARAEAFLNVPLFKKTYDEFKARQLPPRPHGIEQAFVKFGVAPKQKTNARLAFEKSARQAGYFASGEDRLIEPIVGGTARPDQSREERVADEGAGRRQGNVTPIVTGLHPFIQGLLEKLPEPETTWLIEGRRKWLQAAADIFDLMYKGDGDIEIKASAAQRSDRSDEPGVAR